MPFELAESGNDVVADESAVFGTSCWTDEFINSNYREQICVRALGRRIFCMCEWVSEASRFFEGSRMDTRSDRADEDNEGNSRSPSMEAPSERVNKDQKNSHRNILARGFESR